MTFFNTPGTQRAPTYYEVGTTLTVGGYELTVRAPLWDTTITRNRSYHCEVSSPRDDHNSSILLKRHSGSDTRLSNIIQASFIHFARVRSQLRDSGLPDMYFCDDQHLLMELLEGITLSRFTSSPDVSDIASHVRDLLLSLIKPLDGLRNAGLAHRDIKPANLFRKKPTTPEGSHELTLIDFDSLTPTSDDPPKNAAPLLFGSPRYMAQEVTKIGHYTFGGDLYALGVSTLDIVADILHVSLFPKYTDYCEMPHDYYRTRQFNTWLHRDRWPELEEDILKHPTVQDPKAVKQILRFIFECLRHEHYDRPKHGEEIRQILMDTGNITEL